eukprot:TRINITY_DN51089_c0_g2_i1.p1 TRINITY_DN51089_c0_g2~~TRINITY_DN51089_c0_g2_i1.p1  ORF type:complete len:315 (+),score=64.42 TRINITY_DN51089_c0_g2_i1:69-947(+)
MCIRDRQYVLELATPAGLAREHLVVSCRPEFDRVEGDEQNEDQIERVWQNRVQANPRIFNGSKFRFERAMVTENGDVRMELGLTDYKSYLGTNLAENWEELAATEPVGSRLASPLGNGCVVETMDGHVVLLRRSEHVGECPGQCVVPGGHPEPSAVETSRPDDGSSVEFDDGVRNEMWEAILNEVVEETGIGRHEIEDPRMIGISRRVTNHRPTVFFVARCRCTSAEVLERYKEAADIFESVNLFCMERQQFVEKADECTDLVMPGCHRGGAALYGEYLNCLLYTSPSPRDS